MDKRYQPAATPQSNNASTRHETGEIAEELVRDWQFLFAGFLLFGLLRLGWMYLYHPENGAFNLGIACGFLFCGALGFLMRYVLSPRLKGR